MESGLYITLRPVAHLAGMTDEQQPREYSSLVHLFLLAYLDLTRCDGNPRSLTSRAGTNTPFLIC